MSSRSADAPGGRAIISDRRSCWETSTRPSREISSRSTWPSRRVTRRSRPSRVAAWSDFNSLPPAAVNQTSRPSGRQATPQMSAQILDRTFFAPLLSTATSRPPCMEVRYSAKATPSPAGDTLRLLMLSLVRYMTCPTGNSMRCSRPISRTTARSVLSGSQSAKETCSTLARSRSGRAGRLRSARRSTA